MILECITCINNTLCRNEYTNNINGVKFIIAHCTNSKCDFYPLHYSLSEDNKLIEASLNITVNDKIYHLIINKETHIFDNQNNLVTPKPLPISLPIWQMTLVKLTDKLKTYIIFS